MKKSIIIIGRLLALTACVWVVTFVSARPGVSLTFLEYKRWPHGAMLRLTNGTAATIRYIAEQDGTPMGSPVLCLQKTPRGWTNAASIVMSEMAFDSRTGKTTKFFFLSDSGAQPKPGELIQTLLTRDLKPGQSVEFFVRLEPEAFCSSLS